MKHLLHKVTLMVAAVMLAISASAVKFEYKGVFYNLDLDSKTASVTYTGETPEGNTYSGEISIANKFKYEGEYYRVTSIGEKAFYGCDGIVYVKIGGLVTSIASQAFGNNSMKSLIIPSQVVTIAEDAFSGSSKYRCHPYPKHHSKVSEPCGVELQRVLNPTTISRTSLQCLRPDSVSTRQNITLCPMPNLSNFQV